MGEGGNGARSELSSIAPCSYVVLGPYKVWLSASRVNMKGDEIASVSASLEERGVAVLGVSELGNSCSYAQALLYAIEDRVMGTSRARRLSLEALLYVTGSRQIKEALLKTGNNPVYAVVASLDPDGCFLGLSMLRGQPISIKDTCNIIELEDEAKLHLELSQ